MKFFKHLNLIIATTLLGTPVLAQETVQCTFTTECFESETCSKTVFNVAIEETNGQVKLVSDAETIPASIGGSDTVRIYVGVTESAFHLMSRAADGVARYTTHIYEGPMMVNYLGTCEGTE